MILTKILKYLTKCIEIFYGDTSFSRSEGNWDDNIKMNFKEICCQMGGGWNWLRILSSGRFWY
jgi:hypothetical protein